MILSDVGLNIIYLHGADKIRPRLGKNQEPVTERGENSTLIWLNPGDVVSRPCASSGGISARKFCHPLCLDTVCSTRDNGDVKVPRVKRLPSTIVIK